MEPDNAPSDEDREFFESQQEPEPDPGSETKRNSTPQPEVPSDATTPNRALARAREAAQRETRAERIEAVAALMQDAEWLRDVRDGGPNFVGTIVAVTRAYGVSSKGLRSAIESAFPESSDSENTGPKVRLPKYAGQHGRMAMLEKGETVVLSEFNARIVEEIEEDDGTSEERKLKFRVRGWVGKEDAGDLGVVDVPAEEFTQMDWPIAKWGSQAIIHPGRGVRAALAAAIAHLSQPVGRRVVYAHIGWRRVEGRWVYLTPAGAIGGTVDVEARFDKRFDLSRTGDVKAAVQASLRLLDAGDSMVTYPITASAYTSVLYAALKPKHAIWVKGKTGSYKTTYCTLAQCHFGDYSSQDYGNEKGPPSWLTWSESALETYLHAHKDMLTIIDNYVPKQASSQRALEDKAMTIIQTLGDGGERGRSNQDGSARQSKPVRSLCLMTGEDAPASNASTIARLLLVHVKEGSLNLDNIKACQDEAHLYPIAMRAYIEWLVQGGEERLNWLRTRCRELASQGVGGHARGDQKVAVMLTGLEAFLAFARSIEALTAAEAEERLQEAHKVFPALLLSAEEVVQESPVEQYLGALRSLIQSGEVRLMERDQALNVDTARGPARGIGWVAEDEVLLDKELSWKAVRKHFGDSRWPYQEKNLYVHLREQGFLLEGDNRRYVGGGRPRVLVFPKPVFADYIPPPPPEPTKGGDGNEEFPF